MKVLCGETIKMSVLKNLSIVDGVSTEIARIAKIAKIAEKQLPLMSTDDTDQGKNVKAFRGIKRERILVGYGA
jgi:hypothetical protein